MNDLYNETIVRNGKTYHYDPDMDIYYCRHTPMSHWDMFGWIYVILALAAICWCVELLK